MAVIEGAATFGVFQQPIIELELCTDRVDNHALDCLVEGDQEDKDFKIIQGLYIKLIYTHNYVDFES